MRPEPECDLNFTVFSAQPVAGLAYEAQPGTEPVTLVFYPTARSPRYRYRGPATLRFFNVINGEVMAETHVPSGMGTALIIFSKSQPGTAGAGSYCAQIVGDGILDHAPGTLRIMNLSGLELEGSIDRQHLTLREGFNGTCKVGATVSVELRTAFKGRTYHAYAETISIARGGRTLLLLLPPWRSGALEVQSRVLHDLPRAPDPRPAGNAPSG
jgi:hypothetical protein